MIDHLTKYEAVVFGALIALGMVMVTWGETEVNIFIGGIVLCAAVIGGAVTLIRALAQKSAGSIYIMLFTLGLLGLLARWFVFTSEEMIIHDKAWIAILGLLIGGGIGVALNAMIRVEETADTGMDNELSSGLRQEIHSLEHGETFIPPSGETNGSQTDGMSEMN